MSEFINNSKQRQEILKSVIRDIHAGGDPQEIKARFAKLISEISAVEVAQLEQELIDEGMSVQEVQRLCDVHLAVFQDGLAQGETAPEMTPGHPVHTFKYENLAAGELLKLLRQSVAELPDAAALERARSFAHQLQQIERIYLRKENLVFPILEKHGVTGPSSVMWAQQDEIRAQLKQLQQALDAGDAQRIQAILTPLAEQIEAMFNKEESILYPTALKMLSEAEWWQIHEGSDEIGYCLIRPGETWRPDVADEPAPPATTLAGPTSAGALPLDTGALTLAQINLMLTHLPIDMTYVDENDTVRYYSQGPERIFVRTPAIIGRKVENCHPPASVHIVRKLVDELRAGERDSAAFWIQMGEKFVHIRYFALRDAEGAYRGTLEVTQEISELRALKGERRLLEEEG